MSRKIRWDGRDYRMLDAGTQAIYRDLAAWMARRCAGRHCPVFGINGAQGSGKSTAAAFLAVELADRHGLKAAVLSLDDFYLPRAARLRLAAESHPLFATRGVPGTHEVSLGIATLDAVRALGRGQHQALPRYSKADDDRLPTSRWPTIEGPIDLILFEGWCVGVPPQAADELSEPVNELEAREDADGRWRRKVNAQLGTAYAECFAKLDALIFLQVPDFECVRRWRWQQEQDTARLADASAAGLQSAAQLDRFIQHYARLTMHALRVLPERADVLLTLDQHHSATAIHYRDC